MKIARIFTATIVCLSLFGCDRGDSHSPSQTSTSTPTTNPTQPVGQIASLSPAATDILLSMNLADRLVGVSNWEAASSLTDTLPRVGDYRTVDWEKLLQLHPKYIVTQYADEKMPAGLRERAAENGMTVVNIRIDRLKDVFTAIQSIGDATSAPAQAAAATELLKARLDRVRATVSGMPARRTLLLVSDNSLGAAGPGTFLDDLLMIAGGKNVVPDGGNAYPMIDREQLVAFNPAVVIHLLPGASEQVLNAAKENWAQQPDVEATREGRVYFLSESTLLLPGFCVAGTAERLSDCVYPHTPATNPTTKGSP